MTTMSKPAPGAEMIAPSSPASRPSPPGGPRPALTPAAGGTQIAPVGSGQQGRSKNKIRLTEVSTVWGDCHCRRNVIRTGSDNSGRMACGRGRRRRATVQDDRPLRPALIFFVWKVVNKGLSRPFLDNAAVSVASLSRRAAVTRARGGVALALVIAEALKQSRSYLLCGG
jgi:hypothetical protein